MNAKQLKRNLRRIVGPHAFLDDPASLAVYSYDASLQAARPDFVLLPQTTQQVADTVSLLYKERIPYVARGAGTNLSGGSIAAKGGAVIALTRMKRILSIEPRNFCACLEPGLTNLELQETLRKHGFFFAPDPASQKVSTIGGNVAENSGGPHCLKYGVTTNHILGLKIVTPTGEIIQLGGKALDTPGPHLLGLFIGSEGTLGIATQITCRILPIPEATRTMLAVYDSTDDAGHTVSDIIAEGILPATLEMMDNLVIRAVEASLHAGYPTDAAAVLIIELDGALEGLDDAAIEIETICKRNRVREVRTARDVQERERLWAGRRGAFGAVARLFPNYSVSDGTVPRTKLPDVLRSVSGIAQKYDLKIGNVFHAGDGNLHPLIFFDSRDLNQVERVHHAGREILEACVEAGGTISGEHGVGAEKIHAMPLVFDPAAIELMRKIKAALDPANLCNPHKILPDSREKPDRMGDPPVAGSAAATSASTRHHTTDRMGDPAGRPYGNSIIEHDAPNLTVTAEAGLSLGKLQQKLSEAGQFLPLDAPPDSTLGDIVASALPGPRRHIYGAVRDLVLGLSFVSADGQIIKAGGKTVKNVAGYDFGKLLIGSWGSLGAITEITFRILPTPKASGGFIASFPNTDNALDAAANIVRSKLNPAVLTLLNARAASRLMEGRPPTPLSSFFKARNHATLLFLGAEGFPSAVKKQLIHMEQICTENSAQLSDRVIGEDYRSLLADVTSLCYHPGFPFSTSEKGPASFPPSENAPASIPPLENAPPGFPPLEKGGKGGPVKQTSEKASSYNPSAAIMSVQISVPCAEIARTVDLMGALETKCGVSAHVIAHICGGAVYSHFSLHTESSLPEIAARIHENLIADLPDANITTIGLRLDAIADAPPVYGNRAPASWLCAIKKCFDPAGLISRSLHAGE
ncbi:FAD-binding protein [Candidatus Poribacteria bacterium]|nr:FAD-binding protein [Candidatus Poribacteria bacterium]